MTGDAQIIMHAVRPFPGLLVVKWCVGYLTQTVLPGAIVHKIYKYPGAGACFAPSDDAPS